VTVILQLPGRAGLPEAWLHVQLPRLKLVQEALAFLARDLRSPGKKAHRAEVASAGTSKLDICLKDSKPVQQCCHPSAKNVCNTLRILLCCP